MLKRLRSWLPSHADLLDATIDPAARVRVLPTRTRVDVGSWLGRRAVWLCVMADRISLLAPGPLPVVCEAPFTELRESFYNHITGELVLRPASSLPVTHVRLRPYDAKDLLQRMGIEESDHV